LSAFFFDIHPNVVAIPFLLMAIHGFRQNPRLAMIGGFLAALGREDVAAIVIALGLIHWSSLAGKVLVVAGTMNLGFWLLMRRQSSATGILYGWLDSPARIGEVIWADGLLILPLIALTVPWVFFPLDKRYVALAGLASLPWILADSPIASTTGFHYWALPVSLMAASVRPGVKKPIHSAVFAALGLAFGPFGFGFLSIGPSTIPRLATEIRQRLPYVLEAHRAISVVPNVPISVSTELSPLTGHLSEVYILPHPFEPLYGTHGEVVVRTRPALDVTPAITLGRPPSDRYEHAGGIVWRLRSVDQESS
jgi:hypothetical protein